MSARTEALCLHAKQCLEAGDLAGAESAYRGVLDEDPTYAQVHLDLATLLDESDRSDEAAPYYRAYIELMGGSPQREGSTPEQPVEQPIPPDPLARAVLRFERPIRRRQDKHGKTWWVWIDERRDAKLTPGQTHIVTVKPGEHTVGIAMAPRARPNKVSELRLSLSPGEHVAIETTAPRGIGYAAVNRVDWPQEVGAAAQPQVGAPNPVASELPARVPTGETPIWQGKPHVTAGVKGIGTRYELTSERLMVKTGVLGKTLEEMEVIRVKDVRVQQTPADRALGVGSVTVISTDPSTPALLLHKVSDPARVKELLRRSAEGGRQRRGMTYRESL